MFTFILGAMVTKNIPKDHIHIFDKIQSHTIISSSKKLSADVLDKQSAMNNNYLVRTIYP